MPILSFYCTPCHFIMRFNRDGERMHAQNEPGMAKVWERPTAVHGAASPMADSSAIASLTSGLSTSIPISLGTGVGGKLAILTDGPRPECRHFLTWYEIIVGLWFS